jgi:hypothetical protein
MIINAIFMIFYLTLEAISLQCKIKKRFYNQKIQYYHDD